MESRGITNELINTIYTHESTRQRDNTDNSEQGMTESRFNTPKANPGPEKRRRSEPAHSLGFQDEEEEMRKIARQNASESRG